MVASLWKLCFNNLNVRISSNLYISTRNGHHLRGKPPGIARTLQERLDGTEKKICAFKENEVILVTFFRIK